MLALQLYGRQDEDPYAYIYVKTLLAARKADYVPKGWKTLSLPTHSAVAAVAAAGTSGERSQGADTFLWKKCDLLEDIVSTGGMLGPLLD